MSLTLSEDSISFVCESCVSSLPKKDLLHYKKFKQLGDISPRCTLIHNFTPSNTRQNTNEIYQRRWKEHFKIGEKCKGLWRNVVK